MQQLQNNGNDSGLFFHIQSETHKEYIFNSPSGSTPYLMRLVQLNVCQ